jgi:hypothetical protein
MTAKLPTVNDHILAGVEAAGAMGGSIVASSAGEQSQDGFMQFDCGYPSPYFVTDPERMKIAFENAYFLFPEKQTGSKQDLLPLLEQITKAGKPLVIVAEDVQGEALATLVVKNLSGPQRVAAVRAPGCGDQRKKMLQGVATHTGGKAITEGRDIQLKNIQISDLGQAAKITIDKNYTVVKVKAAYGQRIRMPLYANLSLPPEARNNSTMAGHRELAPRRAMKSTEEVQEHEYFQICRRLFEVSIGQAESGLSLVVNSVLRGLASKFVCRSRPRRAGAVLCPTDSRPVAAVGRADCAVSGFAGGADSGGVDLSRAGRRG